MSEPINYTCYIRFPCPQCGWVITPSDICLSVLNPKLHGVSLEQAYHQGDVLKETVHAILTRNFECEMQNKAVRPLDIATITLVGY
jgi:alkyl hydroperoxide reductase subunit AhpF